MDDALISASRTVFLPVKPNTNNQHPIPSHHIAFHAILSHPTLPTLLYRKNRHAP